MSENFKFSNVFNSQTVRGRANVSSSKDPLCPKEFHIVQAFLLLQVAKATWASVGAIYLFFKMQRDKAKRLDAKLYCKGCQQMLPPR
ncbi:hypothetical protein KR032_008583 [Drosophila birchii]|nr:hypothetical protein KR032_008583 [Drosophila birchii]